jgi:hypothetical protein
MLPEAHTAQPTGIHHWRHLQKTSAKAASHLRRRDVPAITVKRR